MTETNCPASKECVGCSTRFERKPTDRAYNWNRKRYCSQACAGRGVMRDPAVIKRQLAGIRAKFADDPDYRERHRAAASINGAKGAANRNPKKVGESLTRNKIGMIPLHRRADYRRLVMREGAAEAKRIILQAERDEARRMIRQEADRQAAREAKRQKDAY